MEGSMTKVDMRGVRQRLIGEGIHKEDVGEWLEREEIIKYLNTSNSAFYRRIQKGILPRATWYKSRKCWNTVQCDPHLLSTRLIKRNNERLKIAEFLLNTRPQNWGLDAPFFYA